MGAGCTAVTGVGVATTGVGVVRTGAGPGTVGVGVAPEEGAIVDVGGGMVGSGAAPLHATAPMRRAIARIFGILDNAAPVFMARLPRFFV